MQPRPRAETCSPCPRARVCIAVLLADSVVCRVALLAGVVRIGAQPGARDPHHGPLYAPLTTISQVVVAEPAGLWKATVAC
jgi:hypothetical protein